MKCNVGKKPLALYVHIPFCVRKCAYCDFLSAPASEDVMENYVNLLCEEIEREAGCYPDYQGQTVFFGGGTPTVLKPEQLNRILCKLDEHFSIFEKYLDSSEENLSELSNREREAHVGRKTEGCGKRETVKILKTDGIKKTEEPEITLECNPGTVSGADLKKLREAGFNRLSIGLQSMQNEELEKLGRIHTREDFLETFYLAREAGFRNINVDLMAALPGQSVKSYVNSLREVAALHPEHISAYSLIIEEGTLFYERYAEADAERRKDGVDKGHLLPSEEEERQMYELTEEILGQNGYHRYEISNYALPGYECRHNITYWKRGDYLGLGLGAASLIDNCRFGKSRDLEEYKRQLRKCGESSRDGKAGKKAETFASGHLHLDWQQLSLQEQMEEFMFLGLRLTRGISAKEFREYFHVPIDDIYGDVLEKLEKYGLVVREGERVRLTRQGIDVSNVVLSEFLL